MKNYVRKHHLPFGKKDQEADARKLGVRRRNKPNSGELGGMRGSIKPPGVKKKTHMFLIGISLCLSASSS